jgi:hypothetical protein
VEVLAAVVLRILQDSIDYDEWHPVSSVGEVRKYIVNVEDFSVDFVSKGRHRILRNPTDDDNSNDEESPPALSAEGGREDQIRRVKGV